MTKAVPAKMFSKLVVGLWHHLSGRRRRQFLLIMVLMLVSAFLEVVSLGAVLPFLSILVAPDHVLRYPVVGDLALAWGITSADELVLPLTITFAAGVISAAAIRITLLWANTKIAFASGADLGIDVYRRTLYQTYQAHLARNSSEVISGITNKINSVVFGVLLPSLTLISSLLILLAITFALVVIDPMVATVAAIVFGASYALITWITRKRLQFNSQLIAHEQTQVVKALQEGLGGIRDVLLDGTQSIYCDIYRQADHLLRRAQGNNTFIGSSPRFIMEALGMVLIAALAYALSQKVGGVSTALPVLGALALGAQRMLPALQQVYSAWVSIASNHAALADVIYLLDQPLPAELLQPAPAPLLIESEIRFNNVSFRYTNDSPWVLDSLNLSIPKGARVGLVGSTGSGKSTVLDLLMGLLMPSKGELLVNGLPINGNRLRAWQQTIAHVPQVIYLADTTIAENIAFGVQRNAIDMDRVYQAARQAQIADFIESNSSGYDACVGERGIRLSGGQRQRIGIARALYKQASVIVFDEATSALDNITEQSVMEAIEGLNRDLTIILVAHRLTTVKRCDTIIELSHGTVVSQGKFEQLLECSPSFRKMGIEI